MASGCSQKLEMPCRLCLIFQVLKYGTFASLPSLQELELSDNNLETVEHMAFKGIPRSLVLHLANNPIQCDARVCWLKRAERNGSIEWDTPSWYGRTCLIRYFHINTKLAAISLMPTLYSHIFAVFFIIWILKMLVNVKLDSSC